MLEIRKKPEAVENGIFQINLDDKRTSSQVKIVSYSFKEHLLKVMLYFL